MSGGQGNQSSRRKNHQVTLKLPNSAQIFFKKRERLFFFHWGVLENHLCHKKRKWRELGKHLEKKIQICWINHPYRPGKRPTCPCISKKRKKKDDSDSMPSIGGRGKKDFFRWSVVRISKGAVRSLRICGKKGRKRVCQTGMTGIKIWGRNSRQIQVMLPYEGKKVESWKGDMASDKTTAVKPRDRVASRGKGMCISAVVF